VRRREPAPTRPDDLAALNDALRALRVALGPETWRGVVRGVPGASWDLWPGRGTDDRWGGDRLALSAMRLTRGRLGLDIVVLCGDERFHLRVRHPTMPTVSLAEAVTHAVAWAVARGAQVHP
jgi:hypothetical protein